jgi:hypothetical protein
MREIKVRAPRGSGRAVAEIALKAGVASVTVYPSYTYGPNEETEEIKVKTSTPKARRFVDYLVSAPFFDRDRFVVSSHHIRSLLAPGGVAELTEPFLTPASDVHEDFWQGSHLTRSFYVRAFISAILLGYATLRANVVLMIGALFFTLFSPPLLAIAFGGAARDKALVKQGSKAFLVANVVAIAGAALAALIAKGPVLYNEFGSMASNIAISALVGVVAAFADFDDVGQRQFIALAAAFPYAKFPIWIGLSLVLGFPEQHTVVERLVTFGCNVLAMVVFAGGTYLALDVRHRGLCR